MCAGFRAVDGVCDLAPLKERFDFRGLEALVSERLKSGSHFFARLVARGVTHGALTCRSIRIARRTLSLRLIATRAICAVTPPPA